MVQSNELRIGNLIRHPLTATLMKVIELNATSLSVGSDKIEDVLGYEECSPIPLTTEILEKCGFRHKLGSINTIHEYFIGINPVTHDWLFDLCYIDSVGHRKFFYRNGHHTVTYLHQLQNLYFALTGEELNYTP